MKNLPPVRLGPVQQRQCVPERPLGIRDTPEFLEIAHRVREGLHAGRSAQAVGAATTTAVVKGLVWLVVAACGTTVAFSILEI